MKKVMAFLLAVCFIISCISQGEAKSYTYVGLEVPMEAFAFGEHYATLLSQEDFLLLQKIEVDIDLTAELIPFLLDVFLNGMGTADNRVLLGDSLGGKKSSYFSLLQTAEFENEGDYYYCCMLANKKDEWVVVFRGTGRRSAASRMEFQNLANDYLLQVKPAR